MATILEIDDQLPRTAHRLDVVDHLSVGLLLGGPDVVSKLFLDVVTAERSHHVIATHTYVAMDPPQWQDVAVCPERVGNQASA